MMIFKLITQMLDGWICFIHADYIYLFMQKACVNFTELVQPEKTEKYYNDFQWNKK